MPRFLCALLRHGPRDEHLLISEAGFALGIWSTCARCGRILEAE